MKKEQGALRLFLAVNISDAQQSELDRVAGFLKQTEADVKWIAPRNRHITLKFLGNTAPELLDLISKMAAQVAAGFPAFSLGLGKPGAFPSADKPQVIWVGIDGGAERLSNLAAFLDEALGGLGFEREARPFEPHLTIGRVRSSKKLLTLAQKLKKTTVAATPETMIREFSLFKSTMTKDGSVYECLSTFKLGGRLV